MLEGSTRYMHLHLSSVCNFNVKFHSNFPKGMLHFILRQVKGLKFNYKFPKGNDQWWYFTAILDTDDNRTGSILVLSLAISAILTKTSTIEIPFTVDWVVPPWQLPHVAHSSRNRSATKRKWFISRLIKASLYGVEMFSVVMSQSALVQLGEPEVRVEPQRSQL